MAAADIGWWEVAASLVLLLFTLVPNWWLQLGIGRRVVIAALRAAVQLVAVGYLLRFIIDSASDDVLAWGWVVGMVVVTAWVARRRAPSLVGIGPLAFVIIGCTTAACLAVIFGLGVLAFDPLTLVVVAGITIGNTMPSVLLAANRVEALLSDGRAGLEALLALGFDRNGIVRFSGGELVRTALIPQVERTNVVGLIALPGAMTGLLLAGAEPLDAVLVQLIVMYLVLGSVSLSVVLTVVFSIRRSFTDDLRLR